jgi:amino acid adenylation domain-containing protein
VHEAVHGGVEEAFRLTPADIEGTISARFEAVVRRHPDRTALTGRGRQWTYAELNRQANVLARGIHARTSRAPGCVALLLDQSPEMVIATLAVLKAGKAYLAVHPGLPAAAQAGIVRDIGPELLLAGTARERRAHDAAAGACRVIGLDTLAERDAGDDLALPTRPDAPSTIFHTSGSTGRPKGVVKSHRAVLHRIWLAGELEGTTVADRQSLLTHCSFAASEGDMFGALLQGATLCTFDAASEGLPAFRRWLDSEGITLLHPPVLLFRRFLSMLEPDDRFPSVRVVALAGDVVLASDLEGWKRHFPRPHIVLHRFSTTETALLTVARLDHDTPIREGVIDAGWPVPGKEISIVDDNGQPVAHGQTGELAVASEYLADGYWGRPDETAAAFAADPNRQGWRTYRTGDLGRFLEDGRFMFLGRQDHQVKIRGYRVDAREVESALQAVAGVREAAVVATRTGEGERQLVGFVVPREGTPWDPAGLRATLRTTLSEWQVPARFEPLEALPSTLTGKVDRRRLVEQARPAGAASSADSDQSPPVNDVEGKVAAIFARLLGLPTVGHDADFFDLGGNSMSLAELQLGLASELSQKVTPQELLLEPTVTGVARILRRKQSESRDAQPLHSLLVPIRRADGRRPLFLVHGGMGRAVAGRRFLDALGGDQPVYGFRAKGLGTDDPPHRRVIDMASTYIALMRGVQPTGPYFLGAACAGCLVALEMAHQLEAAGHRVAPLLLIDPPAPPRDRGRAAYTARTVALWAANLLLPYRVALPVVERLIRRRRFLLKGQMRVWVALRLASYLHRISPYDGTVHVISSRQRIVHFRNGTWSRYLTGTVEVIEAGAGHLDVFDPDNARAAEGLRQYAEAAHGWMSSERESQDQGTAMPSSSARSSSLA